jgi:peptidoglycan/xylan/chitin deacetylase (PgdA/CDA1 family)
MRDEVVDARRSLADVGKTAGGRVAQALNAVLGSRAHGRFGILYYHRLTWPTRGLRKPSLNVDPATFRAQLVGLRERGFRFSTIGEILQAIQRGSSPPRRTVVLTFDDGYEGVYRYAWPVLRELDIRASLFVASAFIGSDEPFPFDPWGRAHASSAGANAWMPLSWAQCTEMANSLEFEIGTHTHQHADFRGRPADLVRDIRTSVRVIRERSGVTTSHFSFPFGDVGKGFASAELANAAREAGMLCGLTTAVDLVHPGADPFTWGRFEATGSDTAATLAAKLDGWYGWMEQGRRAFRAVIG